MMGCMNGKHLLRGIAVACAVALGLTLSGHRPDDRSESLADPCQRINELRPGHNLGSGNRVLFALAKEYGETRVVITSCVLGPLGYTKEWRAEGFTGRDGFAKPGPVKVNSLQTPSGSYSITEAFGRNDPGTMLPYNQVREGLVLGRFGRKELQQLFPGSRHLARRTPVEIHGSRRL